MVGVQSVRRAFAILRALAQNPMGVTELSNRVELPKSTVARLLAALEEEGAVSQDGVRGMYKIGDGLSSVISDVPGGKNITALAYPYLARLATELDETAGIGLLEGRQIFYADHVEPDAAVQVKSWTGEYAPLHLVPSGLVVLGHFSENALDEYLRSDLATTSPKSVSDPGEIRARLDEVRCDGYAWGFEEFAEGLNSVAAPVYGQTGEVVATLHVHGPAYRFPKGDDKDVLGSRLIETCAELGRHLV
ncbi:MAG: IclR family transcriptional regulator [Acidimicrobiales bacterium]|jgi:DNA-binding IclR family transcriptional regulator|nr:IclR family transcriptional regulator [Acidimicrobiales bacterium]MDP6901200.1 IclR family transcriptional regulator [Acidimicrobiales bacterium]HJL99623.1 IclR family transcriptional regulator [Acidimicrobiales bacterium]